jgi:hypothetical protein
MECSSVQEDLIAYHLAALEAPQQDLVEGHLLRCSACLRAYLLLKRQMDRGQAQGAEAAGAADADRPSAAARKRLRDEVQRRFARPAPAPSAAVPLWQWLRLLVTRPIPLYQGVFAVVLGLLLMQAGALLWETPWPGAHAPGAAAEVDSARRQISNVSLY